jgi:hypothetical protein
MRREQRGDVMLREGGRGTEDQVGIANRFADIGRDQRKLRLMAAFGILDHDARTSGPMRRHRCSIAPPQPHLMALQRKIARRRKRTIAAAEHRDAHGNPHLRHARPCAGHPRLSPVALGKTWMAGRSPTMTSVVNAVMISPPLPFASI